MEAPLRLNVGGTTFLVSLLSLKRYPSSILAAPDLIEQALKSTDPPFIDRDPDLFQYILSFLRCELPVYFEGPNDRPTRRRLAYESRFYKLPDLENALKPRKPGVAEKPDLTAVPSTYLHVICEKHIVYDGTMRAVSGHFVIEGKAETQRSWLGFKEEKMTQAYCEQVAARLQGYLNKGYEVRNVDTSTTSVSIREGGGEGDSSSATKHWCLVTSSVFLLRRLP